jgi:hypothetical protein
MGRIASSRGGADGPEGFQSRKVRATKRSEPSASEESSVNWKGVCDRREAISSRKATTAFSTSSGFFKER